MKTSARARLVAASTRKLGLVAALVRGQQVIRAEQILTATPKRAAIAVNKVLASAVANAENNHNLRKSELIISEVLVGPARTLKRARPRSRGSSAPIRRRSSHLTITVSTYAEDKKTLEAPEQAQTKVATEEPKAITKKPKEGK
jgi:large subunit ribosomal protein L22